MAIEFDHRRAVHESLRSRFGLVASLVGMWLGQKFRARLPEETFRKYFFISLLLLGGHLALHRFL